MECPIASLRWVNHIFIWQPACKCLVGILNNNKWNKSTKYCYQRGPASSIFVTWGIRTPIAEQNIFPKITTLTWFYLSLFGLACNMHYMYIQVQSKIMNTTIIACTCMRISHRGNWPLVKYVYLFVIRGC